MKDATILAIVAMLCLVIIEVAALYHGIDHALLATIVAIIAGLGGYEYSQRKQQ